jgi:hypothetical protein
MIQEIDIYETAWYKIVGLSKSTYMLYKVDSKQRYVDFYFMETKAHINFEFQRYRQNQIFNH